MPRRNRQWFPGAIYHIISRGNRKAPIFLHPDDVHAFQTFINDASIRTPFNLHAYCFMTNHYHMLIGTKNSPIHQIMHAVNTPYAQWFNKKYDVTGHVFENRYTGIPIPSEYSFMVVSAYIHNNPRVIKQFEDPSTYPYSSYSHYLNPHNYNKGGVYEELSPFSPSLSPEHLLNLFPEKREWSNLFTTNISSRSPPEPFTKEKLESLFPLPFSVHYERYVEREWKMQCLQQEQAKH
ncbi:transposase [Evansella halocellulosilytica]|uniref:transposase n=1 Tax=Evansella halocellulosilytica TaxID=2011013 RepID=UPI0015C6FDB6|nr:transposase [Evansella halocellulosilytica]